MKSVLFQLSVLLACLSFLVSPAVADVTYTQINHRELQAVFDDGSTAWPGEGQEPYPVTILGVVINNPEDMSDYTNYSPYVWWQTYIQSLPPGQYGEYTVAPGDYGGTALYIRAALPWEDPPRTLYDADQWADELDRLIANADTLHYGDVVAVRALAPGMFYNGKFNVNEKHLSDPAYDFTVTVIGQTTPEVATLDSLADLKDESNNFIFDDTRESGCEHYQASLVHLDGLLLQDAGDWALDGTVVVRQGDLTFDLKLGLDQELLAIDAARLETTPFSVSAILDQEDRDYSDGYKQGYRLWLTSAENLSVVPEPAGLALLAAAGLTLLLFWRRQK